HKPTLSLPPIRLETFDGSDITRWPAFKFQIESLILDRSDISEAEKVFHIRSCLKGTAHSLIASLPVQGGFLTTTMSRLESEYGRHVLTQARLIQSLRSIRSKTPRPEDQLTAVRAMINIAYSINKEWGIDGLAMQQTVAECINSKFITLISRKKPDSLLSALLLIESQLNEELEEALTISAFSSQRPNSNGGSQPHRTSNQPPNTHASSTPKPSKKGPLCVFCGQHTYSAQCTQVSSAKDRKDILRTKSLCLASRLSLTPVDQLHASITGVRHNEPSVVASTHDVVQFQLVTNRDNVTIRAVVHDGESITNSIHHQLLSPVDLEVIKTTIQSVPHHLTDSTVSPDLLLGVGDALKLTHNSKVTVLPSGYRLIQSSIGPIVAGSSRPSPTTPSLKVASIVTSADLSADQMAERFLSVDPISRIYETTEKEERKLADEMVSKHFDDTQLITNLYVDNIIINVDTPSALLHTQSKHIFESMSMNLRDYASNSSSFMTHVPEPDRSTDSNQKLLGLTWNTTEDTLAIKIPISPKREKESKRSMLSTVSSAYDPLGLLNPLLLPPRLTVQSLWNVPLKWDEPVNETTRDSFHDQITDLEQFSLPVDRFTHISEADEITLVAFSDASKWAMAASVYSYVPGCKPSLLISKTRLAPINSTSTIPKMELDSLVMAHTLLQYTVDSLRKEFPEKQIHTYTFSDSAVVLHWCKPTFNKPVGVFVSNRVKLVHSIRDTLSSDSHLTYHPPRHVRSEQNPADHATRGLSSSEMNEPSHQWWIGPHWLSSDPAEWPDTNLSDLQYPDPDPFTLTVTPEVITPPPLDNVIDLTRYSSLKKAINVTSFVYRFITRCATKSSNTSIHEKLKHIPTTPEPSLSATEKRFALNRLISFNQRSVDDFLKKKTSLVEDPTTGLFRVHTRLTNSARSADFKQPIFIHTSRDATLARLLIKDIHASTHAGMDVVLNTLKSRYMVPRARPLAKSTLKQCIPCRKTNNLPFAYPKSPPLPGDRVKESLPFAHCGIDYAGPFHLNDDSKIWSVVITCFSTRVTHLEVVSSLLPSAFILAFRRFCSCRGTPQRVTSDKATTFKLGSTLLSNSEVDPDVNTLFSSLGITWFFTTAHSPWKGGIYERLIKIIKDSFSRSIGRRKLSREEFDTVTCEVEALLNSRPLTYVSSDDVQSFNGPALRPIDLILPNSFLGTSLVPSDADDYHPPEEENSSREAALRQLRRSITVVDTFWKRWNTEYLTSLRDSTNKSSDPLQSTRSSISCPQPGSIVLVIDESGTTPRSSWKMAKIFSLTKTSATLRSHTGRTIERPLNLLIPLEIHSSEET
ncbi:hypothetical protein PMAYCL1PPCAC_01347, partial [Pristionchus mayeri]